MFLHRWRAILRAPANSARSRNDKNDPIFNRIPLELSMTWLSRACWWLNSIFNQCGWKLQAVWCPLGEHREPVRTAGRNWTVSFKNPDRWLMRREKKRSTKSMPRKPVTGQAPASKKRAPPIENNSVASPRTTSSPLFPRDWLGRRTASNKISSDTIRHPNSKDSGSEIVRASL